MRGDELYEERDLEIKGCDDSKWYWQKVDDGAWKGPHENWNSSHFEKYFKYTPERMLVVTAGANMGLHVRPYSQMFETVYAFEPETKNFHALVRNNFANNVYFFKAALGPSNIQGKLINTGSERNQGMYKVDFDINENLPIFSIDSLNLHQCSLIQLDTEGTEDGIILGAIKTISSFRPTVIVENDNHVVEGELTKLDYVKAENSVSDRIYIPKERA